MNKIIMSGRFTDDPELKITPAGVHVTTFSIAVKRPRVKDKTDFFNVVAWRAQAEFICKHFKKGDGIEIVGTLTTRDWTDKQGNKRRETEIECDEVSFPVSSPKRDQSQSEDGVASYTPTAYTNAAADQQQFVEVSDDVGLPF